jgi:hypothetical protein
MALVHADHFAWVKSDHLIQVLCNPSVAGIQFDRINWRCLYIETMPLSKASGKHSNYFKKAIDPHVTSFPMVARSFRIIGILKEIKRWLTQ